MPEIKLSDALDYGRELTPAENRRRLNKLRSGDVKPASAGSSLPGEAPNSGFSAKAERNQHPRVKASR